MGQSVKKRFESAGANFRGIRIRFSLPPALKLYEKPGCFTGATIWTSDWTTVSLELTMDGIRLEISPALYIDTPGFNVYLKEVVYTFGRGPIVGNPRCSWTGRITKIDAEGWGPTGRVKTEIENFFNDLISGTQFDQAGYNPLRDKNAQAALLELAKKLKSSASGGPTVRFSKLTGIMASVTVENREPIVRFEGSDGVHIKSGSKLTFGVHLSGTAARLAARNVTVGHVSLEGENIKLHYGGEAVAMLEEIRIEEGKVKVVRYTPLGSAKRARDWEIGLRGLGILLSSGGSQYVAQVRVTNGEADPKIVDGLTRSKLEKALTEAMQEVYRQHRATLQSNLPGRNNLDIVFGYTR